MNVIYTATFFAYVIFLTWRGFRPRPGFASWHMFAAVSRCRYELRTQDGEGINIWEYVPHSYLNQNRMFVELLLLYLRTVHGVKANGRVELFEGFTTELLNVRDGHVVDC